MASIEHTGIPGGVSRIERTEFEIRAQQICHEHQTLETHGSRARVRITHDERPCSAPGTMRVCIWSHRAPREDRSVRKSKQGTARNRERRTHVRPVERLMPARNALRSMASMPRCTSFPNISEMRRRLRGIVVGCKWARVLVYNQPCEATEASLSCDRAR